MEKVRKHVRPMIVGWLMVAIWLGLPLKGLAAEDGLNFYVTPEFPESQVEGSDRYYDLNLAPGATERLSLTLQNASSDPIDVQVTPHTAYTNVHGVVEYGKDAETPDGTLMYSLDTLITSTDVLTLLGNETKTVTVDLQMPEEAFEGFLAGGLRISEVKADQEDDEAATDEEGVAIKNEFAYVIGVVVSNRRDSVQPELDLTDVFSDQLNYRNVISATLQNMTPTFVNRLAVEATVQRAGENDVLYEAQEEGMQMAPNSHFNFPISLNGDRFQAGEYVLKLTAKSGEEEWSWEQTFTIEADEARALNREDVTIDTSTNWWMIGALALLILLVGLVIFLIMKQRATRKTQEDQGGEK